MEREYLAQEFVDAYNDWEEYLNSVLELLENPALESLIAGIVEKTEQKMKTIFELEKNKISMHEAFYICKNRNN